MLTGPEARASAPPMDAKEYNPTIKQRLKQSFFAARQLQLSVAVMVVFTLIGGIILQSAASELAKRFGLSSIAVGLMLIVGYIFIIIILAVAFAHRFVGPFKRLEYEMKLISSGDLGRRLHVRTNDELAVKHFIRFLNKFIASFDDMSKDYNQLSALISTKLDEIEKALPPGAHECERLKKEIKELRAKMHSMREKW